MGIFNFLHKKPKVYEIGKTISWKESINIIFKIIALDNNGTVVTENGNVKAKSAFKPYGYLDVTNPNFPEKLRLPIVHKDDYYLIEGIFNNPKLTEIENLHDILVVYRPKFETSSGSAGFDHALHYVITPKGTLEEYDKKYGLKSNDSILENIFIRFSWDIIQVEINDGVVI